MKATPDRRWPAGSRPPTQYLGLILLLAAGWLTASCGLTDLFGGDDEDDANAPTAAANATRQPNASEPTATRTPTPTPTSTPTPTPTPTPVPPEVQYLRDLAGQWSDTDTVHFELDIDGKTYIDESETIELGSAEGDLKRPDQTSASAEVGISFASFDVDIIIIGDDAYMTSFLSGDWERAPDNFDFNPALLFDERRGIGAVLEDLRDPRLGARETIDGRRTQMLAGFISGDDIDDLVAGSLTGDDIEVIVWMDTETEQLLRISLAEPEEAEDPTTWTIEFSNHDEPVTITAPDL